MITERVDDDAEVDRADGEQIGRFAPQEEHGEGEQQRQRHVDGHDQRGADVAEEHQQHHRHQAHAGQQVFPDRVGGDVDQVGAVVIGLDLHARQQAARRFVELLRPGRGCRARAGSDCSPLRSSTMPWTTSSSSCQTRWPWASRTSRALGIAQRIAAHHVAQAGLVADDHALAARRLARPQRSAFDHVVDADRDVVGGAEHDLADLADAALPLRRGGNRGRRRGLSCPSRFPWGPGPCRSAPGSGPRGPRRPG